MDLRNLPVVLQRVVAQTISRFDHLAAMGNHACCGHNAVAEPEAVAPVPEKPQEETVETLELAAKDVIIETTSKEVEEIPSPPTSPSSADKRKAFGGRVVSSCSLQGIHVDEDAEAKKQITAQRLRADTQQSVMSMTSTKSIVEVISDFFRGSSRPDFNGEWVCIATWGLDEFLKEMGISYMKRLAASKAPWPSWEFQQNQDKIKFCNHTMLGDINEEFVVDGPEYSTVDGHKQTLTCQARWEGSILVIERNGPQGRFREERSIDPTTGELHFKLQGMEANSSAWGRKFKRKGT